MKKKKRQEGTSRPFRQYLYFLLFGFQTSGAILIYWTAIPLFREALSDPASYKAKIEILPWTLLSIALIQIGYWVSYYLSLPLPRFKNVLIGHFMLFAARLGFVLATSLFFFIFLARKSGLDIPDFNYIVIVAGMFSLYCYTREFERLASSFLPNDKRLRR